MSKSIERRKFSTKDEHRGLELKADKLTEQSSNQDFNLLTLE